MAQELQSLSHLRTFTSDPAKIVVIDFYAHWCGPCKMIAPHYERLAQTFAQTYGGPAMNHGASVVFLKCNVDTCKDVASFYKITSMPTFLVLHEEAVVERFSGADIGRVEKVARDNLAYVSQKRAAAGLGGGNRLGGEGGSGGAGGGVSRLLANAPPASSAAAQSSGGASAAAAASTAASSASAPARASAVAAAPRPAAAVPAPNAPLGENVLLNAPARHLTAISAAVTEAGGDAAKAMAAGGAGEKAAFDLLAFLKSQTAANLQQPMGAGSGMPFGAQLIPFLVCEEYSKVSNDPLELFLKKLLEAGAEAKAREAMGVVCDANGVCSIPTTDGDDNANTATDAKKSSPFANLFSKFTPAEDAAAIVVNISRIAVNALSFETWHVVGAGSITAHTAPNPMEQQMARAMRSANNASGNASNKPPPPAPYTGRWHTMLHRLLRSESALKILFSPGLIAAAEGATSASYDEGSSLNATLVKVVAEAASPSPLVLARWMTTGKQLELNTILGALLSPGLFPARASLHQQQIQTVAMLNPSGLTVEQTDHRAVRAEIESHIGPFRAQVHNEMDAHVNRCFPIFRELLGRRGAVRTHVLRWLGAFFAANAGFTRQNREKSELCSETALLTLSHVFVELALPIINARGGFEATIPTDYYRDLNAAVFTVDSASQKASSAAAAASAELTPEEAEAEAEAERALVEFLQSSLNNRALVHFGLSRSDVERVCHFTPLKAEVLDDPESVAALLASSSAADGASSSAAMSPTATSSSAAAAADDDNANTAVDEAANETFPLPHIVGGSGSPSASTGDMATAASAPSSPTTAIGGAAALSEALLSTHGVHHYAPRVHIFYMALRAISLTQTIAIGTLQSLEQQISHPRTRPRDKAFLLCLHASSKALLTNDTWARKTVQFLNGAARWLLHIVGADRESGALPTVVPSAWRLLPQQVIDEVLTAMTLVTKHNVTSLHPSDLDDIISLFLVLMGNLTFFPKAHTHALFPTMVLELLQSPLFAPALVRHRWYQSNIVLGCVRTYIAMEKCYYEKTSCRYYLSVCLKKFLAEDVLCHPARPALQDTKARTLERFTHMVTTEANQAIDDVLGALSQMRVLEAEGRDAVAADGSDRSAGFNNNATAAGRRNRRRNNNRRSDGQDHSIYGSDDDDDDEANSEEDDGDNNGGAAPTASNNNVRGESYAQLGERLKNGLLIFNETIAVFKLLARQFNAGVLQHMVAQQISNMLVQNIAKLAGRNSAELKVKQPELWGFKPRETLEALVDCFVSFRGSAVFVGCVLESMHSVTQPEVFDYALTNITNVHRMLVVPSLAADLREMHEEITKANVGRDLEERIWDDEAPEWAFCALLSTPLKNPVVLPMPNSSSDEDLLFVEHDVIRHRLLELEENPFSRQRLTEAGLAAYNAQPEIRKAVEDLKARIAAYAAKRRAELIAAEKK